MSPQQLTPLGQRTLAGFQTKYGQTDGQARFQKAVSAGHIDPAKLYVGSVAAILTAQQDNMGKKSN